MIESVKSSAILPDVKIIQLKSFEDDRGTFAELWNEGEFIQKVNPRPMFFPTQDNCSESFKWTLRGLHFQKFPFDQEKLVTVLFGSVQDVVVDITPSSATFGMWDSFILNNQNGLQIYIPKGYAHGFLATSGLAILHYKVSGVYDKDSSVSIKWDDPALNIGWNLDPVFEFSPILSEADKNGISFESLTN
jgi:dTDP-4-dehydrorhamnose 3,5-epimerase